MTESDPASPTSPNTGDLRVRLLQMRPEKGRVERNLARVREAIGEATGKVDLLVLPECVLSGYFVEGGAPEVARSVGEVADSLGPAMDGAPDVVLGFYERGRGPTYNAAAWFTPREGGYHTVRRHRKVFLPTYGIFDEARFVSPGAGIGAFDTRFGRVGLLVCEEMLHSLVPAALALDDAELLVVVAASPVRGFLPGRGVPGNLERWDLAGRAVALEHGVHVLVSQLVGSEGGRIFPGGSAAYAPEGEVIARAPLFATGATDVVLDWTRVHRQRARYPLLADLRTRLPHLLGTLQQIGGGRDGAGAGGEAGMGGSGEGRTPPPPALELTMRGRAGDRAPDPSRGRPASGLPDPEDGSSLELDLALVEEGLVSFLHDEIVSRRGFRDVVVGVSGGVDSAASLFLAARALGPDHVHAFLLPYATSSPESLEHGRMVLEAAGVKGRTIQITPMVDAYLDREEPKASDLRRGNVAARVRALILWDQAARLHALPLGTGNKSERLLGYFTWHADDSPPINPLGDLYKTQVWALARHLGVPTPVVEKAPSADLVRGVHDEDEIGVSYPVADRILHWILDGFAPADLVRAGFPEDAVDRVCRRLEGTHWKRELPTVATLSDTAIGEFYLRPVDY